METVEVVIRIPKDTFDAVGILQEFVGDTHLTSGYQIGKNSTFGTMIKAIANGTVLPKGHGRLIDADAINIHNVSPAYGMEVYGVTQDDIEYEPTVIEADREVQDEK